MILNVLIKFLRALKFSQRLLYEEFTRQCKLFLYGAAALIKKQASCLLTKLLGYVSVFRVVASLEFTKNCTALNMAGGKKRCSLGTTYFLDENYN